MRLPFYSRECVEKDSKAPPYLKVLLLGCFIMISLIAGCRGCKKTTEPSNGNEWDPRNVSRNKGTSFIRSLAVDNGNVYIVWADDTPGNYEILYSQRSSNGNWSEPVNISNTPTPSEVPRIGIDPSGNLHVVWREYRSIFYSMKPNGGDWSEPIEISSSSDLPELGVDANGNVHAVWMNQPLTYRAKVGGSWLSPEKIPSPTGAADNPAMTVSPQGDVHVAFEPGYDPAEVFYTMKPFSGSWTEPVNVSESSLYSWASDIAMDNENVYIAWKEVKTGVDQVFFRIRASDGSWSGINSVPDIIGEATGPWVTIAAKDGRLHFLWEAKVGDNIDIYHKARNEDASWSENSDISNTGGAGYAVVVLDVLGNLHVAWNDESPGNWDVFYTVVQTK